MDSSRALRTTLLLLLLSIPVTLSAQEWEQVELWGGFVNAEGGALSEDLSTGVIYLYGNRSSVAAEKHLYRLAPGSNVWEPLPLPPAMSSGIDLGKGVEGSPRIASGPQPEHFAFDGTLFVDWGYDGFFRTTDDGATWERMPFDGTIIVRMNGDLYASGPGETFHRSRDTGRTWETADDITWPFATRGRIRSNGRQLFIAGPQNVIYRSDPGNVWTKASPSDLSFGTLYVTGDTLLYHMSVYRKGDGLLRSYDRGTTWEPDTLFGIGYDLTCHDGAIWWTASDRAFWWSEDREVYRMALDGSGKRVVTTLGYTTAMVDFHFGAGRTLIADQTGVQRWDQAAGRFVPFDTGRTATAIDQLLPIGDAVVARSAGRIDFSHDDGRTWERRSGSNGPIHVADRTLYRNADDSLLRSDDFGRTWSGRFVEGLPDDYEVRSLRVHGAGVAGADTILALCGDVRSSTVDAIVVTTDGGRSWDSFDVPPSWGGIRQIAGSGRTLFALMQSSGTTLSLSRSDDFGAHWTALSSNEISSQQGGDGFASIVYVDGVLHVVTTARGLMRSFDQGATWERAALPAGSPLETAAAVTKLEVDGTTLFLHVDHSGAIGLDSLYASIDHGATWNPIAAPPARATALLIRDGRIFAGTEADGLWVSRDTVHLAGSTTLGVGDDAGAGGRLDLAFDATSDRIRWSTPSPTSYAIDLYTIAGKHVMTVERGDVEAGEHVVALPELAGGVYLCTIRTAHGDAGILVRVE